MKRTKKRGGRSKKNNELNKNNNFKLTFIFILCIFALYIVFPFTTRVSDDKNDLSEMKMKQNKVRKSSFRPLSASVHTNIDNEIFSTSTDPVAQDKAVSTDNDKTTTSLSPAAAVGYQEEIEKLKSQITELKHQNEMLQATSVAASIVQSKPLPLNMKLMKMTTETYKTKHTFKIFLDKKHTTSAHATHPDALIQQWDEQETSYMKDVPYRYLGSWRECRQECDKRSCAAFKYEIGHQTCLLLKANANGGGIQKWDDAMFQKWARYTSPQLDESRKKGRFKYHQHIWGLVLSKKQEIHVEKACNSLGGDEEACTKEDIKLSEKVLDAIVPEGNMINTVFLTNPFTGVKEIHKLKPRSLHVDWRMCQEMCRAMDSFIHCLGFKIEAKTCTFYRNINEVDIRQIPIKILTDDEADLHSFGKTIYGLVRSPRKTDQPLKPFVPHLPISPDVLIAVTKMMIEKSKQPWGKHILSNSECPCDSSSIGFPDVVKQCAPNALSKLTRRNFRNGNHQNARQEDQCIYDAIGKLIKKQDPRLLKKGSSLYDPDYMRKELTSRKTKSLGSSGASAIWKTYPTWPIGACPVAAPECIAFINVAHHVNINGEIASYSYRKCCIEHIRLAYLTHVANNVFDMLNVYSAVVFGSLIGPLRSGGVLPTFDTDIDGRVSSWDLALLTHWLQVVQFDSQHEKQFLLELGPHENKIMDGSRSKMEHVSFFYGPKTSAINVDSHFEIYSQTEHYMRNHYGATDDIVWPPIKICMYGRMVSIPRKPCEFSSMIYGGNPCVESDTKHKKLDLKDTLFGVWNYLKCNTNNSKKGIRMNAMKRKRKDSLLERGGSSKPKRSYTCTPGRQGPAFGDKFALAPGSLEKCKRVCDLYLGCSGVDFTSGSCRIYIGKNLKIRPAGDSGRTFCGLA
jgi:hypothetical protein